LRIYHIFYCLNRFWYFFYCFFLVFFLLFPIERFKWDGVYCIIEYSVL